MSEEKRNFKINSLKDVQAYCSTNLKFRTASLRWTINNYNVLSKSKNEITSPEFPEIPVENKKRKWLIKIYPGDETVWITFSRNTEDQIFVDASLTLENFSGEIIRLLIFKDIVPNAKNIKWTLQEESLSQHFFSKEPASKNSLILTTIIRVSDTTETIIYKALSTKHFDSKNLSQDMSTFFRNDQSFCDITITTQGKTFKAHKAILAARSEVFAAMLSNVMLEKINSCIEIKDLSPKTVEKMLNFIYTDQVDDLYLKETAAELLGAAEQYNLQKLKKMCIAVMYENLAVENVLKTLQVADLYSISDLKEMALRFLVANRHVIKNQDEFKSLFAERPHLIVEFFDIQDNIT